MVSLLPISSLDHPGLAEYHQLRDRQLLHPALKLPDAPHGLFIAEGELVVEILAASDFPIRSLLLTPARAESMRETLAALPPDIIAFVAPPELMDTLVGFHIHRGVLASAARKPPADWRTMAAAAPAMVVLEDLTNHDNIGGLFRCVAGLLPAGSCILLSPRCGDPLYRKSIRVSMGHALRVPFATIDPWPDALSALSQLGFTPLALAIQEPALTPAQAHEQFLAAPDASTRARKPAIVLGSEGPGLTPQAIAQCVRRVRIPMTPGIDSLNVVVAGAIAMHSLA